KAFPGADVEVLGLDEDGNATKVTARGWEAQSLPLLRAWFAAWRKAQLKSWRSKTDEDIAAHREAVDQRLKTGGKPLSRTLASIGQEALFPLTPPGKAAA